ncbi:MAG TPA: hypothetical protein DDW49_00940 [Deltaproteobacteria bacterium]|nr:MAG: hypothetical protein A2048_07635 [Deltaproteobacteria bacterium GWA2_45_12]HBF11950.1 hypothetical protein [Deltaproteobacteria bacterium]
MENSSVQTIHLPTYFHVLERLPSVLSEDIQIAQATLHFILGDQYGQPLVFNRGRYFGDGLMHTNPVYLSRGGGESLSMLDFQENGLIAKSDGGLFPFIGVLPPSLVPYFFGGIFGVEEMKKKPSEDWVFMQIQGAWELYQCLEKNNGDSSLCQASEGNQKIAEAKKIVDEKNAVLEKQAAIDAEKKRSQEHEDQMGSYLQKSEEIWLLAEKMRQNAQGLGDGDPDVIEGIMKKYLMYRNYIGAGSDLENAKIRYEKALEMLEAFTKSSGSWNQFENFCDKFNFGSTPCREDQAGGGSTDYHYSCPFDITVVGHESDCRTPVKPFTPY